MSESKASKPAYRVVVLGKVGSGKSTVCNKLLSREDYPFPVYKGFDGQTTKHQCETKEHADYLLHVVDTPDVFNMGYTQSAAEEKLKEVMKTLTDNIPTAIILTVRLDLRFTPDDSQLYRQYRSLLPPQYKNNIILAATHTENFQNSVREEIKLSSLQKLLDKIGGRLVSFSDRDSTDHVTQETARIIEVVKVTPAACQASETLWGSICAFVRSAMPW